MSTRRIVVRAASGIAGVVLFGGLASGPYAQGAGAPLPEDRGALNAVAAEQDVNWITSDTSAQRQAQPRPSAPPPTQPLQKTIASGPIIDAARAVATKVAPAGLTVVDAVEYPDAKAATVTLSTPDGTTYQIAVQRLPRVISASEIAGPNVGKLSKLQTGSELLEVTGSGFVQAIVVRDSGLAFNVSVFTNSANQGKSGLSASALAQSVANLVDNGDLEGAIP